jgi:predicted ester cyclase
LTARRLNPSRWALTFAVAAGIECGNQYFQVAVHKEECHMSLKELQAKIQWAGEEA